MTGKVRDNEKERDPLKNESRESGMREQVTVGEQMTEIHTDTVSRSYCAQTPACINQTIPI